MDNYLENNGNLQNKQRLGFYKLKAWPMYEETQAIFSHCMLNILRYVYTNSFNPYLGLVNFYNRGRVIIYK